MKRAGFTLAEVLIVLGIIGVVASFCIPTLIQKVQHQEIETKLKKFYSDVNQAINLSKSEYGDMDTWDYTDTVFEGGTANYETTKEWCEKYFCKYIKRLKSEYRNINGDNCYLLYFNDGSIMCYRTNLVDIYFFTNEKALESNVFGKNRFCFSFFPIRKINEDPRNLIFIGKGLITWAFRWDGNIETLKADSTYGCNKTAKWAAYCARLIQLNGWKIPDDYPY